jgi:hypothetical protein
MEDELDLPMNVIVTHELCAYREAIAGTIRALRPAVIVWSVAVSDLDRALLDHAPRLVICSNLTELVRARAPSWVLLYPGGADRAEINILGAYELLPHVALDRLLDVVDRAA